MKFKVSKGLNIPISGNINPDKKNSVSVRNVALLGEDYHGLKPTMLVKEGNVVIKGQNLFEDKKNPGVKFTSPVSGKIVEINRGERRSFLSMVIEKNLNSTSEVKFESFQDSSELSKDSVVKNLIESGTWTSFKTRPFSKIPKIDTIPEEIFISLISSDPLSLNPDDKIQYHEFEGIHPVGLVGTQIHRISPVSLNRTVWTINYQDVAMIGRLFKTGSLDTTRMVAFCGPQVETPCLIETEIGASISEVSAGKTLQGNNRFISGSVLCGREANSYTNYLGRYNSQISVLREVEKDDREFLNFLRPGLEKHSVLPVFLTKLKEKFLKLNYTTAMNGADRAIVPIGIFEDIFPYNIMVTQLLKSIVIGDTELAQKLGILELDEEDLALCTYACPSKYDYGSLLREMLTKIEEEG